MQPLTQPWKVSNNIRNSNSVPPGQSPWHHSSFWAKVGTSVPLQTLACALLTLLCLYDFQESKTNPLPQTVTPHCWQTNVTFALSSGLLYTSCQSGLPNTVFLFFQNCLVFRMLQGHKAVSGIRRKSPGFGSSVSWC